MTNPVNPSSAQAQARAAAAAAEELEAKIVKISIELRQLDEQLRLSGEVTARSPDGTVRIHTPDGDIDIKLPPGQPAPRVGEKVTVEIQAGDPPSTARITREAPPPAPDETQGRGSQTPVDVRVGERPVQQPPVYSPADPTRPLPPPAPGQPVELEALPYPPENIDPLEILTSIVTQAPEAQAQIAVQNAEAEITKNLNIIAQPTEAPAVTVSATPQAEPPFAAPTAPATESAQIVPKPFFQIIAPPPSFNPGPIAAALVTSAEGTPAAPIETALPLKFTARIAAITPPQVNIEGAAEKPLILQNLKAGVVTGKVVALTAEKFPVISFQSFEGAPESFFLMRTPAPGLVPGTEISFMPEITVTPPLPGAHPLTPNATIPAPLSFLTPAPWPLMDEIYETLAQYMPHTAQAFSNVTPSPGNPAQLGPAALFFIAAINGGDLSQWLGDKAVDALRRSGKSGLISRLGAEGNALNRLASEPVSGEWRAVALPMFWQDETQRIALYFRHDSQNENEDENGGKQVRFIFDLNLDKMGDVQLDGLFRPRRLDLIVRSEQPFSKAMQMKMMEAYINALAPTEVRGELSFQNKPEQWVTIKASGSKFGASA